MSFKQEFLVIQTSLALGLTSAIVLIASLGWGILAQLNGPILPAITARQFLLTFLLATALFLFLVRTLRSRALFEIIFAVSLFSGVWFLAALVAPAYAHWLALLTVALRYALPYILVQNLVMIIGIAGIGSALGSATTWQTAFIVLLALAFYDVIAVYGTKHMVTMFKGMLERGVIFALVLPERPKFLLKRLAAVSPQEGFYFLGSGDLVLPAFFVASASREGLPLGIGAAVGAMVGIFFSDLLFSWGRKRPMPALPPIALGTLTGFFIAMFVRQYV